MLRLLSIAGVFCATICALAQDAAPAVDVTESPNPNSTIQLHERSRDEREAAYRAQHRFTLNVLVNDGSGRPVTGLQPDAFTLLGDQKPEKIESVRAVEGSSDTNPVHAVIVLDAVDNSSRDFSNQRKQIQKFLSQNERLPYPTSILLLANAHSKMTRSSTDRRVLATDLREVTSRVQVESCAEEANDLAMKTQQGGWLPTVSEVTQTMSHMTHVQSCEATRSRAALASLLALAQRQVQAPGRILLIWVGPGWPLMINKGSPPDTEQMKRLYYDYLASLSTTLMEAQITVDAVSPPDPLHNAGLAKDYYEPYVEHVPKPDNAGATDLALPVLATRTGGQVLLDSPDVAGEIAACMRDADSYYVLTFDSKSSEAPNEFRKLQLDVDRPGATVRTSTAYYAQP